MSLKLELGEIQNSLEKISTHSVGQIKVLKIEC